ncbi:hypothetical protein EBZ39_16265, partial [bacterium]|nr:hypothetical protein [bacterium]
MDKLDGDASITVKHGDTDEVIGLIQIEPETRNVIWRTTDTERFSVIDSQGNHVSTGGGVSNIGAPDSHEDGKYWSIEKMHFCTTTGDYLPDDEAINACYQDDARGKINIEDHLVVSLPNGKSISLKVHKPGPYTPDFEPHEIYGQAEMVFNLMLAIKLGKHSILKGPTGLGKTTVYQWLAKKLGYNLFMQPISRGTQDRHMVGEYAPAGPGDFKW